MLVLHLDTVDSTNTYVLRHFQEVADRIMVSAREQTAGRGRLGRRWIAPPGCNLTASIGMSRVTGGFHAGIIAGLSVLDMVREAAPEIDPYLKWPNDVYVGDAKLAGILCEGVLSQGKLAGVVAGIGININFSIDDAAGIDQRATSLKILSGREYSVNLLAKRLAFFLDRRYIDYDCSLENTLAGWRRENKLIGREIEIIDPSGKSVKGLFAAIDDDGSMLLDTPCGRNIFRCGDVKITRGFDPGNRKK